MATTKATPKATIKDWPIRIRQGEAVKKGKFMKVYRGEVSVIAEEWLERMKAGNPVDNAQFLRWLKESPLHVREMLTATTWDKLLDRMLDPEHKVNIDELRTQLATNVVPLGGISRHIAAAAALVKPRGMLDRRIGWSWLAGLSAAAGLAIALVLGWPQITSGHGYQEQFATAVGEQRSVGLADGSVVTLNTRSRVEVDFSAQARDVYLLEGQAIFKVKHDATRPFRVHVDAAVVQAIGTQFDVYRLKGRTSVTVIEGVVQIIPDASGSIDIAELSKLPANTKVPAGETVTIVADGKLTPHANVDAQEATAWQQRRLVFRNRTLAEIAAEFNRYNRIPQIRIEGAALQAMRLTSVFDADDPQSLLTYLALDNRIAFEHGDDELVIRMQSNLAQAAPSD
jgi:transmembrane sensor